MYKANNIDCVLIANLNILQYVLVYWAGGRVTTTSNLSDFRCYKIVLNE